MNEGNTKTLVLVDLTKLASLLLRSLKFAWHKKSVTCIDPGRFKFFLGENFFIVLPIRSLQNILYFGKCLACNIKQF